MAEEGEGGGPLKAQKAKLEELYTRIGNALNIKGTSFETLKRKSFSEGQNGEN